MVTFHRRMMCNVKQTRTKRFVEHDQFQLLNLRMTAATHSIIPVEEERPSRSNRGENRWAKGVGLQCDNDLQYGKRHEDVREGADEWLMATSEERGRVGGVFHGVAMVRIDVGLQVDSLVEIYCVELDVVFIYEVIKLDVR